MASPSKSDVRSPRKQIDYFVPRAGIDREVITTDIIHYLGDDALVRPGNYQNPQTGQTQQGYFITAYRNLTTKMIADLKADSELWEAERRRTASTSRGQWSGQQTRAYYQPKGAQEDGPSHLAASIATAPKVKPSTSELPVPTSQAKQGEMPNGIYASNCFDHTNANTSKRKEGKAVDVNEKNQGEFERDEDSRKYDFELTTLGGAGVTVDRSRKQKRRRKMLCVCWEVTWER